MSESIMQSDPHEISVQISNKILSYIRSNKLGPETKLPSENKLAQHFGVNRNIVRSAYARLCSQGYVRSIRGKGHYPVKKERPLIFRHSADIGFSEIFGKKPDEYENKIVSWTISENKHSEGIKLNLEEGELIYRLKTLRTIKGDTIALCYSHIPAKYVPDFESHFENFTSINKIFIDVYGYEHPVCDSISVKACTATADDLKYLNITENSPVISISSAFSTPETGVIEYFVIHARGDKFIFNMDFTNKD